MVWQKSVELAKCVYELTGGFPKHERFGLVMQLRRAAVSIPSNVAEGQARHQKGEFIRFISCAQGSVAEIDTQLVLSEELGFCGAREVEKVRDAAAELRKMLAGLRRALSSSGSDN